MQFFAVIGKDNTRKSSIIYSLTGTFRRRPRWELEVNGRSELVYVDPRSAQERADLDPKRLVKEIRAAIKAEPALNYAVLAFHHKAPNQWTDQSHSAVAYLEALYAEGWTCSGALFTARGDDPTSIRTGDWLKSKQALPHVLNELGPSNAMANSVRSNWGL